MAEIRKFLPPDVHRGDQSSEAAREHDLVALLRFSTAADKTHDAMQTPDVCLVATDSIARPIYPDENAKQVSSRGHEHQC